MILLQKKYNENVAPEMKKKFGYSSIMAVPRIQKVIVHSGTGRITRDNKGNDEEVVKYLTIVTGQKPIPCKARKSIATFKTRQGQTIGYKVTLRGQRMYDFLLRLIGTAIPRMRDFRGINVKQVDHSGNLTIGIREHIIFPETVSDDVRMIFGFEVTVVSNTKTRAEALELFQLLGFPLKKA